MPGRKQIVVQMHQVTTPSAATAAATPADAQVAKIARPEMEDQNILLLPSELLILIFSFLSETSQAVCRFVCHDWNATIRTAAFGVIPRMLAVDIASSAALMVWQQSAVLKYRPFDRNTLLSLVHSSSADKLERIALFYRRSIIEHWKSLKTEAINSGNLEVLQTLFELNTRYDLKCSKINKADQSEATISGHRNIVRWIRQDLPLFSTGTTRATTRTRTRIY